MSRNLLGYTVGYLGKWDLFQPSEEQEYLGMTLYPNNLLLRGSDASIIFPFLDIPVIYFIDDWLDMVSLPQHLDYLFIDWQEDSDIKAVKNNNIFDYMYYDFNSATQIFELVENCRSKLANPYSTEIKWNFEKWLISNIGEFVYFSMMEAAPLQVLIDQYYPIFAEIDQELHGNITTKPMGYPGTYGYYNRFKELEKSVPQISKSRKGIFSRNGKKR